MTHRETTTKEQAMTSEITLTPREQQYDFSGKPLPTTTHWIKGSRERYGAPYFISTGRGEVTLWLSNRPYAVNDRIAKFDAMPTTWDEIDDAIANA